MTPEQVNEQLNKAFEMKPWQIAKIAALPTREARVSAHTSLDRALRAGQADCLRNYPNAFPEWLSRELTRNGLATGGLHMGAFMADSRALLGAIELAQAKIVGNTLEGVVDLITRGVTGRDLDEALDEIGPAVLRKALGVAPMAPEVRA